MSRLLTLTVCRVISLILLALDLSQEPESGVTFASIGDSDPDTIAELCTKENFSWSVAAAVENASPSSRDVVHGSPLFEQRYRGSGGLAMDTQRISAAQSLDTPSPPAPILAVVLGSPPARDGSTHRNTSLAHKRDVVLIV